MRKILFVDDEQKVLDGLRRMLHSQRHEWDMEFVTTGEEALKILAGAPFDVIVSDMRMPGMDGAVFLNEVRRRYPHSVRIVLSGQSDQETVLRSISSTHQYLAKPCDSEVLRTTVMRACALRDLLASESLRKLVSGMQSLPSLPGLYVELMEEMRSSESSIKRATQIIAKDIGMTSKVLQLANSAFFMQGGHVSTAFEAVRLLGLDTVRALVLSDSVFAQYRPVMGARFSIETLWRHSMRTSAFARGIAKAAPAAPAVVDQAFTAGLLHDVGILALFANLPEQYAGVLALAHDGEMAEWEAESRTLGATHAEVGAYLLGLWGLSDAIVEAVAFHHCPGRSVGQGFSPLVAVHVANVLEQEDGAAELPACACPHADRRVGPGLDIAWLNRLGLADRLSEWRAVCRAAGPV